MSALIIKGKGMQVYKKIIVVMPAYNAERTLEQTMHLLPHIYDEVILCDDGSVDNTFEKSRRMGITTIQHGQNKGYGANQKTLYAVALKKKADIIIMVHPDNQYNTKNISAMVDIVKNEDAAMVLGDRMETALKNGMPRWKYIGNRFLTSLENIVFKTKLSEFHSGLRVYDARIFRQMPFMSFSNDFVFDSEVIAWLLANDFHIREVQTECYYNGSVSSVSFYRSMAYGISTIKTLVAYKRGVYSTALQDMKRINNSRNS